MKSINKYSHVKKLKNQLSCVKTSKLLVRVLLLAYVSHTGQGKSSRLIVFAENNFVIAKIFQGASSVKDLWCYKRCMYASYRDFIIIIILPP